LDTNILLALIRGNNLGSAIDTAYSLRASLNRHVVSIASRAELSVLADQNGWGEQKRATFTNMFDQLVVVSIDSQQLVDAYVQISAAARAWHQGIQNMGKNDIWIAATSLVAGLPLITTDGDFKFLDGNPIKVFFFNANL
jgi:tRNA(fMet)-specific endonuclease VapC